MSDEGEETGEIEQVVSMSVPGGNAIDVRLTIASAPKVGPGRPPRRGELLVVRRVAEDWVLTVSIDLLEPTMGAIVVGGGGPPVADN